MLISQHAIIMLSKSNFVQFIQLVYHFLNTKIVEKGDRLGQNPVLPAGQHAFNFSFVLPPHLKMPSSVELGHCNIRYMVEAVIDKPWKFDHKAKRAFTLLESIDCNDPSLSVSIYS